MRKLACDGVRTTSRGEQLVSARQEILTSLVSALDSVVRMSQKGRGFFTDISFCGVEIICSYQPISENPPDKQLLLSFMQICS